MNSGRNDLFTGDGLGSALRISCRRGALSRTLQGQELLLLGSVFDPGLCPADLSRESARHRGLSANNSCQALSQGHSRPSVSQHIGPCQPRARWENLGRLRPKLDRPSPRSLSETNPLPCNSSRRSMPWTRPRSICAGRCWLGLSFVDARPPSSCTRGWICAAAFPRWSSSRAAKFTKSLSSISWSGSQEPFI